MYRYMYLANERDEYDEGYEYIHLRILCHHVFVFCFQENFPLIYLSSSTEANCLPQSFCHAYYLLIESIKLCNVISLSGIIKLYIRNEGRLN